MKGLSTLLVLQLVSIFIAINGSDYFIDHYVDPSVRQFCTEKQENISFEFAFRARRNRNPNTHVVYLLSMDKVFSVYQMTAALRWENTSFALNEIFFNEVNLHEEEDFWNGLKPNETFNAIFTDYNRDDHFYSYNCAFLLSGDRYRMVNLSLVEHKVTLVHELTPVWRSIWGFMNNTKIKKKGFENIFSIDIADSEGEYNPVRVFVKDNAREGKTISFAFPDRKQNEEEFENGKHYDYSFNSAAYLSYGRSFRNQANKYNHYFELRTRNGTFSLFDFQYNKDFLLVGANEELLGCPPSFCHMREFDDVIRLHDGTELLVYKEWSWKFQQFNKTGGKIVYEDAVIFNISSRNHQKNNFGRPFKYGIRTVVDGSFIDDSTLYIFRNGSFVSSKTDNIINNSTEFFDFTQIGTFFKGVPSQVYDAILYHKESRTVYFIREDKYRSFSMSKNSLISDEKHVENLGLPYDFRVRSIYVEEDDSGKQIKFYLFTKNRYIIFDATDFNDGRFRPKRHPYYCTSVDFFGCPEEIYSCPPPGVDTPNDDSNLLIYLLILVIIIIVLVVIIGLLVMLVLSKNQKNDKQSESAVGKNSSSDDSQFDTMRSKTDSTFNRKKQKPSKKGVPMASYSELPTQRSKTSVYKG